MDPTDLAWRFNQICDQMDDFELEKFVADPRIKKIMDATLCEESHNKEHHWPFNIDREEERLDCIYCGETKREVMAEVVNSGRRRTSGPMPKKGSFPRPGKRDGGEGPRAGPLAGS